MESERKFKVGDLVKGNDADRYGITNTDMTKGKVVELINKGKIITVEILEHVHDDNIGHKYNVCPEYFDYYTPAKKKFTSKSKVAPIVKAPVGVTTEKGKLVMEFDYTTIRSNGATIVMLNENKEKLAKGVSKCDPADNYDSEKGEKIAIRRAIIKQMQRELKGLLK